MSDPTPKTKPKLLVILGAGSSVELGMPMVDGINAMMQEWARKQAEVQKRPDYFAFVWENRRLYAARAELAQPTGGVFWKPSYEKCLADMLTLMNAVLDEPKATPLEHALLSSCFLSAHGLTRGTDTARMIYEQYATLVSELAAHLRRECRRLKQPNADDREKLDLYGQFFASLENRFDLGVYNLNHDTVALSALAEASEGEYFTGFVEGRFVPTAVQRRREWRFLYHLHGCVRQSLVLPGPDEVQILPSGFIEWKPSLAEEEQFCDAPPSSFRGVVATNDARRRVLSSLVAGGWKLDQLQIDPFQAFYSTILRHAHEADAILIAGYGFGDPHVESVLSNALVARRRHRPPVMVIDRRPGLFQVEDAWGSQEDYSWISTMQTTLGIGPGPVRFRRAKPDKAFGDQSDSLVPYTQEELWELHPDWHDTPIPAAEFALFEKCEEGFPVALWFGGMRLSGDRKEEGEIALWRTSIADWLLRHVPAR